MTVFYTHSTAHIVKNLSCTIGAFTIKKFSDGEIYVKIEQDVQEAWVIASTFPPADNIIELFFLLNALNRLKAKINLLIPYFGYARQSHPQPGEAASAEVMCQLLHNFSINKIVIIHIHSYALKQFLTFENVIPFELICKEANNVDAIASSDKGSAALAAETGAQCSKSTIFIEKIRPAHEMVEIIKINGDPAGKNILIVDDIISTGNTIIAASEKLKVFGASDIYAYATHALFSEETVRNIEKSVIKKVFVTNTIPQKYVNAKIEVLDIAPIIQKIIGRDDAKK